MARPRTPQDWDERYREGTVPWDLGKPATHIRDAVKHGVIAPGSFLEIGCGKGTDAVWLAQQGFDVTATDVSSAALATARNRATESNVRIRFIEGSFPEAENAFDIAYDRGVLHIFDGDEERQSFARSIARCLRPGGKWLSLCGSTDGPPREHGPPRISARDVAVAMEPVLEILSISNTMFEADVPSPARGFWVVARKREKY